MTADQATATGETAAVTEPPRLSGAQLITNELIDAIATAHCGWSRKQLAILGVSWPLEAGWREKLVAEGRTLSGEEVDALYTARKTKRPEGADKPESPLVPAPCPWCRRLVEPVMQGDHIREFCSRKHKTLFNTALTKASIEHSRLLRTPGALKLWAGDRVHPSPDGRDALPGTTGTTGAEGQPGSPSAPEKPDAA